MKVDGCPFCDESLLWDGDSIIRRGQHCSIIESYSQNIKGARYIITNEHKASPFELSDEEMVEINGFLKLSQLEMKEKLNCDGFNIGWNVGTVAGQDVEHVHLHVIPRYEGELHAGRGIRHWIKQAENRPDQNR